MNKTLIIFIIAALAVGAGGFYGGMKYAESKNSGTFSRQNLEARFGTDFQNMRGSGAVGRETNGISAVAGEIVAKDENSITVKLRDGGSRIIFHSASTEIGKFTDGVPADLEIGKNVSVTGKANSDGSVIAQSIQLRPQIMMNQPR